MLFAMTLQSSAQQTISYKTDNQLLKHGIEQFQKESYTLASQTLKDYLEIQNPPPQDQSKEIYNQDRAFAQYLLVMSELRLDNPNCDLQAVEFIGHSTNKAQKQRVALLLAKHYFALSVYQDAIKYYEFAGLDNLSNQEISDAKFELAYSYFINKDFEKSKNIFANIKEIKDSKYYVESNYYYGLLAYHDQEFDKALNSFARVSSDAKYKDIVPYYETEIYYFKGDYNKVIENSNKYLNQKEKLFYDKELRLLTAQTLFEQKKYAQALPLFEEYYNNSDKIRKEELYEFAYCYYKLEQYQKAIQKFQPLSETNDALGQTSMYLLGDCYLKIGDKKGARNAFGICSEMEAFNKEQKEASSFLYAKLSYDLGHESIATKKLNSFINEYPNSSFNNEAKGLLTSLLAKTSNYKEALEILDAMPNKDQNTQKLYQQVAIGRGLQYLKDNDYQNANTQFDNSLKYNNNPNLAAVAYFWKGDIAYKQADYNTSISNTTQFLTLANGREKEITKISKLATVQNGQVNLGYAQLKSDKFSDAQVTFQNAQKTRPTGGEESVEISNDATIREADAYFMNKDFDKAMKLYEKVIVLNGKNTDYAKYQKALILGIQDKDEAKIELLRSVAANPKSDFYDEANYEIGNAYLELEKYAQAVTTFQSVIGNANATEEIKARSQYKLAYSYQNLNNNKEAIDAYQKFLTKYPAAEEKQTALDALRTLYINQGTPEGYANFLSKQNILTGKESEVEATYYDAAENEYEKGNHAKAITLFNQYLDQYKTGSFTTKAIYYKAESNNALKQYDKAIADYDQVINLGWSDFAEMSAERAAEISINDNKFEQANKYYKMLEEHGSTVNREKANIGMMKAAANAKNHNEVLNYADKVIAQSADNNIKAEANLFKANALYASNNKTEAITIYKSLDKQNIGKFSAEARYRIAEDLFNQKKYTEAEDAANKAWQASKGEEYWIVKNYLLLGDILTATNDYFNAKATYQSVIDNANDKALKAEATEKLKKVKTLEKSKNKLAD